MAEGLLMYFQREDVARLIAACAARFPGGTMMFDVIPRWFSQKTQSPEGFGLSNDYQTPPMPFGINVSEREWFRGLHPNVVALEDIEMGRGRGFLFGYVFPFLRLLPLPQSVIDKRPGIFLLRFGAG